MTPEGRAKRIEEATRWWESSDDIPKVRRAITHEIREAVLAERMRCIELVWAFATRAEDGVTVRAALKLLDAVMERRDPPSLREPAPGQEGGRGT